ncbi:MAG: ATP-grasp domain-containing protein [Candidatus Aenigmarchaeota archaeon]|nr:ATP-grasp domain-containing protein [Candidatus Aenigmarchaeota archaeon]
MKKNIKIIRSAVGSMPSWGLIKELTKNNVDIVGIDSSPISFGLYLLKKSYVVPKGNDPNFINSLINIVKKETPDAIISGPEEEILNISKNKSLLENSGMLVLCPDFESVEICANKRKTYKFFKNNNIPTPEIFDEEKRVKFPCVVKPIFGRGGAGVYVANNQEELRYYLSKSKDFIIQEYVAGTEYTVDVLADRDGNSLSIVPRIRLGIESGVSVKGKTVYDKKIINYVQLIVKKLKLFGPSCIQCIKSSDSLKFIEINTRFGGGSILSMKADPTIVQNLIRIIRGETPRKNRTFKRNLIMLRYYSEMFLQEKDIKK